MKRKQQLLGLLVITGLGIPTLSNAQRKILYKKNIEETVLLGSRGRVQGQNRQPRSCRCIQLKERKHHTSSIKY